MNLISLFYVMINIGMITEVASYHKALRGVYRGKYLSRISSGGSIPNIQRMSSICLRNYHVNHDRRTKRYFNLQMSTIDAYSNRYLHGDTSQNFNRHDHHQSTNSLKKDDIEERIRMLTSSIESNVPHEEMMALVNFIKSRKNIICITGAGRAYIVTRVLIHP